MQELNLILPTFKALQQTFADPIAMKDAYDKTELFSKCVDTALVSTGYRDDDNRVAVKFNHYYGYTIDCIILMVAACLDGECLRRLLTPLGYINLFGQGITNIESVRATKFLLENLEKSFGQKPEAVNLLPIFALQKIVDRDDVMSSDYKNATAYIIWRRKPPKLEDTFVVTIVDREMYEETKKFVDDINREHQDTKTSVQKECEDE